MTDVSDERLAEMCCDLLGWTFARHDGHAFAYKPGEVRVWTRPDGRFNVFIVDAASEYTVNLTTLLIAAPVRHAGAIEVGPCPSCGGSGRRPARSLVDPLGRCPGCKSPGRHVVDATEAVLMAAPWRQLRTGHGRRGDDAKDQVQAWFENPGHEGARGALRRLAEGWREHLPVLADEWQDRGGLTEFGLAAHAGWSQALRGAREDLSIAAWLEDSEHGHASFRPIDERDDLGLTALRSCTSVPRPLAESPAIALWLLAWLDGECAGCWGTGVDPDPPEWGRAIDYSHDDCEGHGLAIGPHLPAIRAHVAAAWEHECMPAAVNIEPTITINSPSGEQVYP